LNRVEKGYTARRKEWHNALQACDLEYILQISATGKAEALLSLLQKIHSSLHATKEKEMDTCLKTGKLKSNHMMRKLLAQLFGLQGICTGH